MDYNSRSYQWVPINAWGIVKSKEMAVPFLTYLKLRGQLCEYNGRGGSFYICQEVADSLGISLRGLRMNVNKGKRLGWYTSLGRDPNACRIISLYKIVDKDVDKSDNPIKYLSSFILSNTDLSSITWKNISMLRRILSEKVLDEHVRTKQNQIKWAERQAIIDEEIADQLSCGGGYSKKRRTTKQKAGLTRSTDFIMSCSFSSLLTGLSKTAIWNHRQVNLFDPLPYPIHYKLNDKYIGNMRYDDKWDISYIHRLNQHIEENPSAYKLEDKGRYVFYKSGEIYFVGCSTRISDGHYEIKRKRIKAKYYSIASISDSITNNSGIIFDNKLYNDIIGFNSDCSIGL
jgi:hypothetical protein